MIHVRAAGSSKREPAREESLSFVSMAIGAEAVGSAGWNMTSARLFAIEAASVVFRSNLAQLAEFDRQVLARSLSEARRLTVEGREESLEEIQTRFESRLEYSWDEDGRAVWLTAMNSLLPNPYRAAVTTVEAAYRTADCEGDELAEALVGRFWRGMNDARPVINARRLANA